MPTPASSEKPAKSAAVGLVLRFEPPMLTHALRKELTLRLAVIDDALESSSA